MADLGRWLGEEYRVPAEPVLQPATEDGDDAPEG
jgi:endogenous inhibitor of DNA gyrase (YacG/DUF329 family)